jgi:hypothetical protein
MKSDLWAEGLSEGGNMSSGRTPWHDVRESRELPSSATTRRVSMLARLGGWQSRGGG